MDSNVIARTLCSMFDSLVRRSLRDTTPNERKALMVRFVTGDHEKTMEMLIYSFSNYVGVYLMRGYSGYGPFSKFEMKAYHSSCWRADGVARIIFENQDGFYFETISSPSRKHKTIAEGIYIVYLSEEEIEQLSEAQVRTSA